MLQTTTAVVIFFVLCKVALQVVDLCSQQCYLNFGNNRCRLRHDQTQKRF